MKKMWAAIAVLIAVGMLIAGCPKANEKPNAKFTPDKNLVFVGGSVNFNASASKDPDGSIKTYSWNFGDGSSQDVTTKAVSHQFSTAGVFNATLYTKDDKGDKSKTVTATVVVAPLPIASAIQADTFSNITFSIDNTTLGSRVTDFTWSYGDSPTPEKGASVVHQFRENGTFSVILTILYQGQSATSTLTVNIANRPPVANISVGAVGTYYSNKPVEFIGTGSSDLDGTVTKWYWQFGDQAVDNGSKVSHAYARPGNYTVSLTVTDNDNATASASMNLTVVKDLVITYFNVSTWLNNASGGIWMGNVTIKFNNDGDAKLTNTVNVTVTANKDDKSALLPIENFKKTKSFDAPIASNTKDIPVSVNELQIFNSNPDKTWYLVEISYGGAVIDSMWFQKS